MLRLESFRSRIQILTVCVLLVFALPVILLSRSKLQKILYVSEEESVRKTLSLVHLMISNQYDALTYDTNHALNIRKEQMTNVVGIVISMIEQFRRDHKRGQITEKTAKKAALEQIMNFRYAKNDYIYVYNEDLVAIAHPDSEFTGKHLRDYRDAKGTLIVQELFNASRMPGGGFKTYWWRRLNEKEPVRKIGYAFYYEPWKWMIGTGLYLDDVDREYRRKIDDILLTLKNTFEKVSGDQHVSLFLFDGNKRILIPPQADMKDLPLEELIKSASGTSHNFTQVHHQRSMFTYHFQPLHWYVAGAVDLAQLRKPGEDLARTAVLLLAIVLLAGLILGHVLAARISKPLSSLSMYTGELARTGFRNTDSPVLKQLAARRDETGELARAFRSMEEQLEKFVQELKETTVARERIEGELRLAREIQMSLLPAPRCACEQYELFGFLEPAQETGGDFYDYFEIDSRHLWVVIADVSDKGLPASLHMAASRNVIRAIIRTTHENLQPGTTVHPHEVLHRVNQELKRNSRQLMFVTIFIGVIDLQEKEMEYSNAGHNPPLVLTGNKLRVLNDVRGLPCGARINASYKQGNMSFSPGDTLFLYTDGVSESRNGENLFYSETRIQEELQKLNEASAEETIGQINSSLQSFLKGKPKQDDIAMLALRFK